MAGTALTGNTVAATYNALLKTTDNTNVTGALKTISDGLGNDSALQVSSAAVKSTGTLDVTGVTALATNTTVGGTLSVTGATTTAAITASGIIKGPDGAAATPAFTFTSDTDTGFYRPTANTIGWTANGINYGLLGVGISSFNGDNTTGSGAVPVMAFGFGGTATYQHFLQTRHNSAVGGTGNALVLWINNSATSGASTAPGTSNVKAFDFSADNLKFYSNSGTLGLTMTNGQGFIAAVDALTGTSVSVDFNKSPFKTLTLSGNTTFATANLVAGTSVQIAVVGDGSTRTLTFPSWKWVTGIPATLVSSKNAVLTLISKSTTDASVIAGWAAES